MHRIDPYQQLRLIQHRPQPSHIFYGVVVLHRIHTALALRLTDVFHIHKNTIHSGRLRDPRHRRILGYVKQFKHLFTTGSLPATTPDNYYASYIIL